MSILSRLELLGVEVDVVTPDQVMQFVQERVEQRIRTVIANHNLHSIYLFHRDPVMRALYHRADLIEIDSMPLVAWGRLLGHKLTASHRSTYLDFRDTFWTLAQSRGWRVFHIGGRPEHVQASYNTIVGRHPGLNLQVHTGYFDIDGPEGKALLERLGTEKPHVILIGMGMPLQEVWIEQHFGSLPPSVILPVGGAFDYEAGATYTPPRWTGRLGLEWLVRFLHDPLRLFGRYFIEPWSLIPLAASDLMRHVKRRPDPASSASYSEPSGREPTMTINLVGDTNSPPRLPQDAA